MLRRGHTAVMLDPYDLCDSDRISKRVDNTYITLVQRAPKVFGAVYAAGNLHHRLPLPDNFYEVHKAWRSKKITLKQAAEACNMPVGTFYGKARKFENVA